MDPTGKTFPSEDPRKWIGRILMAVILGEAISNLIVSLMNNLVVPWMGDLFGQSSGLPTSFTQRPYNYPDLFVSILEFCIAGLVAAIINYFFQRPRAVRMKPGKSPVLVPPVEPVRLVPRTEAPAAQPQMVAAPATTAQPAQTPPTLTKSAPTAPVVKPDPIIPAAPLIAAPPKPVPAVAPTPIAKPSPVAPVPPPAAASVAKPQPAPPKAEPAKPKKSKEVYYNIVGEPMPSDDD